MSRFHLPLAVDFGIRTTTNPLTKAIYIQNGYIKHDVSPKIQNRVGIIENPNQGTDIHIIESRSHGMITVGVSSECLTVSAVIGINR